MRIAVFSDIHLEKRGAGQATQPWLFSRTDVDVVVLAGDIHTKGRGVKWAKETFLCPVVYVLGNHEGWDSNWNEVLRKMKNEASGSNVHVLHNDAVVIDSVRFLGSTLWTDFKAWPDQREAMYEAGQGRDIYSPGMRDYKYIRTAGYRRIKPMDVLSWNTQARSWLLDEAAKPFDGPTCVVTHHPPVLEGLQHGAVTEVYDAAYASDWKEGVEQINAQLWMFGHTHTPRHFVIGNTQFATHPIGHLTEKLEKLYNTLIDVSSDGCSFVVCEEDILTEPAFVKTPKPPKIK